MKNTAHISIVFALSLASFAALSGLHAAPAQVDKNSEQKDKKTAPKAAANADQRQMRDLDEQVQQTKSDVLAIAAELNQLEEKLLYPSGTQVAIFVALANGDQMRRAQAYATNIFVFEDDRWLLVLHHASLEQKSQEGV